MLYAHMLYNRLILLQVSLLTFAVYVLSSSDHALTAEIAFVSLSYFMLLRLPMEELPGLISNIIRLYVSHHRFQTFFLMDELEELSRESDKGNVC